MTARLKGRAVVGESPLLRDSWGLRVCARVAMECYVKQLLYVNFKLFLLFLKALYIRYGVVLSLLDYRLFITATLLQLARSPSLTSRDQKT